MAPANILKAGVWRRRTLAALAAVIVALALWLTYESYRRALALELTRVSAGSRIAETACGPIEFASVGEGPAALLMHGAGGGYDQGLDFAEDFVRAGLRVVTMSRFGYLGTPLPKDASPAAQADAHACLLDALKIERAAIIGASAGAPSTMQLALRHPRRVSAMVLLVPLAYAPGASPAAPAELPPSARFLVERAVQSDLLFWLALKLPASVTAKALLATPPEVLDTAAPEERARIERTLRHLLPLSLRQQGLLNDVAIVSSLPRYELEKIAVPTLVISAADDLFGTYAMGQYTAAHIPGARFVGYPSGGHLWLGRHAELLAEVEGFLGQARGTHRHRFGDAGKWSRVFDDPKRDEWQKPREVIRALALEPDAVVADVGAGTGYFSTRLANMLAKGRVYAVDIEPAMVKHLAERAKREQLANMIAVAGAPGDPRLPGKADLILLVDVYHHIDEREQYFRNLRGALKPGGRIAIVDFRLDSPEGPPKHARIAPERVKTELAAAGYALAGEHRFLPYQYFLLFR